MLKTYTSALNLVCGLILPTLAKTIPRSTSSRLVPRSRTPMLSPASPRSSNFLNISTPVTIFFMVSRIPTISISSPTFTIPRSTLPVTTVPRPLMVNTSSMGIKNSLSMGRSGSGMYSSTESINSMILLFHSSSRPPVVSRLFKALPRVMGISSPGNLYSLSNSRISSSTRSRISSSSTISHLFMNTTILGTFT